MIAAAFEYHRPADLRSALGVLAEHGDDARVIAGGHSLIPMMKLRMASIEHLVDLQDIAELKGITVSGGAVTIGAMTTQHELIAQHGLAKAAPILREAALQIADPQVRYMGTVGRQCGQWRSGQRHAGADAVPGCDLHAGRAGRQPRGEGARLLPVGLCDGTRRWRDPDEDQLCRADRAATPMKSRSARSATMPRRLRGAGDEGGGQGHLCLRRDDEPVGHAGVLGRRRGGAGGHVAAMPRPSRPRSPRRWRISTRRATIAARSNSSAMWRASSLAARSRAPCRAPEEEHTMPKKMPIIADRERRGSTT